VGERSFQSIKGVGHKVLRCSTIRKAARPRRSFYGWTKLHKSNNESMVTDQRVKSGGHSKVFG
jgi:hypothetical protein